MKITFQNSADITSDTNLSREQSLRQSPAKGVGVSTGKTFQGAIKIGGNDDGLDRMIANAEAYGNAGGISSMTQLQQMAGAMDGKVQQDYMTIMSNTMSAEDFGEMIKEGFSPRDMAPEETVTILDKIKAELAKAGKQIAGYNDDLDLETLEAALGSQTLARSVSADFSEADIPLSKEMAEDIGEAWEMTKSLTEPTDGTYAFMLREELPPRIANFYLAQNSGAGDGRQESALFFAAGVQGYYTQAGDAAQSVEGDARFQEQIDEVLRQAGSEDLSKGREQANWLLRQNLPLTREKLEQYQELTSVSFPVSEEQFVHSVRDAILEGTSPKNANLARQNDESLYEKANRLAETWDRAEMADRRLLEEVRLHMTSEVNVKLLRSGFAIDTAPMEELVEALKIAERQVAEKYFPNAENAQAAVSKYQTYRTVNQMMDEFPGMPAKLLGVIRMGADDALQSLEEVYQTGQRMQREMEEAREKYETLMTAPRADLGDSIRKAFANVDEILTDLGYETTEENRKAMRVLGYNRMELSPENLEKVREAQRTVTNVIEQMTPASVLKMIRDDINPLEKSFEELQEYFHGREEDFQETSESYARFLYRLEQSKEITQDERAGFIGIYRMLHQIGKKDGAAVGMLLNTGAEMRFDNLLAAARTGNFGSMDMRLGEQEMIYAKLVTGKGRIDDQIERAFAGAEREAFAEAAKASEDARGLLEAGKFEMTATNLLASEGLLTDENAPFGTLKKLGNERKQIFDNAKEQGLGSDAKGATALNNLWEQMDAEGFEEQYLEGLSELKEESQTLAQEAQQFVDVRALQLTSRQLGIAIGLREGGAKEYFLPLELDGELGKLHLTLENAMSGNNMVTVEVDANGMRTKAEFQVKEGKIFGTIWGNGASEVMKLSDAADILGTYLREESPFRMEANPVIVDKSKVGEGKAIGNKASSPARELLSGTGVSNMTNVSEDAREVAKEISPEELFRVAKLWIKALTRKEVAYEN